MYLVALGVTVNMYSGVATNKHGILKIIKKAKNNDRN